ncbi:MAG: hypothetical protein PUB99_08745, partial [Oscillospiraceae bacterium]|nr:hypothetical protein [Oscillospiraceae bacterium]
RRTKVLRARKNSKHTSSETVRRRDAARVSNAFTDASDFFRTVMYALGRLYRQSETASEWVPFLHIPFPCFIG